MNISEIKVAVGYTADTSLMFVRQVETENPEVLTPWVSHWDNTKRVRITMHEDVMISIKNNPQTRELALKTEVVAAHKGSDGKDVAEYTRYVIITPRKVEFAI